MRQKILTSRRGAVAILAAFLMVILLAFVALAVDLGYIAFARSELQRATDACCLAAAAELPDESAALLAATNIGRDNKTGVTPQLRPEDVQFGYWDRDSGVFSASPPSGRSVNAVRVMLGRTQALGNPLPLFFGRVLGRRVADVSSLATAWMDRGLCGPFIGIDEITAVGNLTTDSFDSRDGPYDPLRARDRGGLCSDGPIAITGDAHIRGDARAGRGHEVTIHGSSVVITGNIGSRVKPLNMPPVDTTYVSGHNDNALLPPVVGLGQVGLSPLDRRRNFRLTGTTIYVIPPGTYYFNDMELSGQSSLQVIGKTVIYLTGNLKRAGGTQVNNNTQLAANLRIFSTGGTVDVTSDNSFYGVIYAPQSAVAVGGTADYFGAIVGRTLKFHGDARGHYDESLDLDEVELPTRTTLVD